MTSLFWESREEEEVNCENQKKRAQSDPHTLLYA